MGHSKVMLEKELQEVIALTSQELEEYREKVLELEDEVGEPMVTWQSVWARPFRCSREKGPWSISLAGLCAEPDCSAVHTHLTTSLNL